MIDNKLLQSCLNQDRIGQKQMYRLLLPYLRAIANRYLRDISYVKDALQESFVKIFLNLKKYDPSKSPLEKWAARITINTCINLNDRVIGVPKKELQPTSPQFTMEPKALSMMSEEHLLRFLRQMPNDYYVVFNLHLIDGYSHQEVAQLLGISMALSRKRLSRGREWIKYISQKITFDN